MKKALLLFLAVFTVFGLAACDLGQGEIDDILNCLETPEDPECLVDGLYVDQLVAEWDGTLQHLSNVMDNMDFSTAMTQTSTILIQVVEGGDVIDVEVVTTDSFVFGEFNKVHREMTQTLNIMGEEISFTSEVIYEEVPTGVHVYFNTGSIKDLLVEQGLSEIVQGMSDLGLAEDWVLFQFDDTLENVIEIEVLRNMLKEVLFQEIGATAFYDLQDEIELELGFDFEAYGIDLGLFADYVLDGQLEQAEAMINAIDFENLKSDFDVLVMADMLSNQLVTDQAAIEAALPGYDFQNQLVFLETNGVMAWYHQLAAEEVTYFDSVYFQDPLAQIYINFQDGTLPYFLFTTFLMESEFELREIPGFDYDLMVQNAELLDYEALVLEDVNLVLLFEAILAGQTEFDAFVTGLETTAPNTALILAPWSESMTYLDDVRTLIDDIELGFENLDMFSEYFTLEYYVQGNMAMIDVEANSNNEMVTNIVFDNYGSLFGDLINDLYWYLDSFQMVDMPYVDPINCPAGEYCEMLPIDMIEGELNSLGPINMSMVFDPLDPDYMIMNVELQEVFNEYYEGMTGEASPLQLVSITIEMEEGGEVIIPTVYSDVNQAAENFAKFSLYFYIYDIMDDLEWDMVEYGDYSELVGVTTSFADTEFDLSLAFDIELSTITVSGTVDNPVISIDLYWVDGTRVFTAPITLDELQPVIGNGSGAPDAAEYAMYLGKVDPANYATTKLILMYLLQDDSNDYDDYYYYYDENYIYWDALMVEQAAGYFCSVNSCDPYMQLTYGDLMPYMGWLDDSYYELWDTNITIVEIEDGTIYVTLEPYGQGNLEFPNWITPSDADPSYVQEDWD